MAGVSSNPMLHAVPEPEVPEKLVRFYMNSSIICILYIELCILGGGGPRARIQHAPDMKPQLLLTALNLLMYLYYNLFIYIL